MEGTMTKLTVEDLRKALYEDDRHLGWGYGESSYLPEGKRNRLDRAVVAVANELGLDYESLFHWSNSKYGRHLCDTAIYESPTRETVRGYLNRKAIDTIFDELGLPSEEDAEQERAYQRASDIDSDAPSLAALREGVGAALMAAAEESDRIEDEIISPASVEYVEVPTNYGSASWAIRIKTKDGSTFRVEAVKEA